jgi:Ion transport protein
VQSLVIENVNKGLLSVYILEFLIKFSAFGLSYFHEGWNILDFSVVLAAIVELLLEEFSQHNGSATMAIIRCFRIVRVMKLIRNFKEMRRFLMTFINSLPALINVGSLLFLFLFIYAIMGMNLFATVKLQSSLNYRANFQTFGLSMLTLFSSSTGENWNYIMNDVSRSRSIGFDCVENQSYDEIQANGI